jgi:hypothetical protein
VGTWHDPDLGRPIAAPLERCAELLGIDLATVHALAANVEPYIRADGTRIWSLMQLERQLRPEAYGRAGAATWSADRPGSPTYSQSGMPQALLGYESFEHRSAGCSPVQKRSIHPGLGRLPTGSRPTLFLAVSASLVSKP